jgi:polyhydroxyalkanoate synthesis regulator phasin
MASKKKTPKPAQVGNLTARHLAKMREDMGAQHAELLGVVSEFKTEVAASFRALQDKLVEVVTDIATATAEFRAADRERLDALEERIRQLEAKAS